MTKKTAFRPWLGMEGTNGPGNKVPPGKVLSRNGTAGWKTSGMLAMLNGLKRTEGGLKLMAAPIIRKEANMTTRFGGRSLRQPKPKVPLQARGDPTPRAPLQAIGGAIGHPRTKSPTTDPFLMSKVPLLCLRGHNHSE